MLKNQTVCLIRGCSGSGKSFLLQKLKEETYSYDVISADAYFIRPSGKYAWNYKELGDAHDWAHKNYLDSLSSDNDDPPSVIFVDNTNLTWKECKFYIEEAAKNRWNIILYESGTDWAFNPDELFKKNVHSVPLETLKNMVSKWVPSEEIARLTKELYQVNIEIRRGTSSLS